MAYLARGLAGGGDKEGRLLWRRCSNHWAAHGSAQGGVLSLADWRLDGGRRLRGLLQAGQSDRSDILQDPMVSIIIKGTVVDPG